MPQSNMHHNGAHAAERTTPAKLARGAVLYDYLHCRGGAEQVTLALVETFSNTDLWVGYRDRRWFTSLPCAGHRIHDLNLPAHFWGGRTLVGLFGFRFRTRALAAYDWAIFSGSVALEGVHQRPHGRNLYYCHTIPRFAYDLHDYYGHRLPSWARPLLRVTAAVVRRRYRKALDRMDLVIANSENVRRRLLCYLGRDARVIHPPCDTSGFRWQDQGNYYLSTARLEPYKRVDSLITAFRDLSDTRLIIASGGSDEARLRRLAAGADNIEFTGWASAERLRALVGNCIATLYVARDEDFGISPVESMAAGKPVIGSAEGGLLETIMDGKTGLLIPADATPEQIGAAVRHLTPARAVRMRAECEHRARSFTTAAFSERMRQAVAELMDE